LHRWGNVAVCKWAAHADNTVARTVSTGDARAEAAAKAMAAQRTKETTCTLLSENNLAISFSLQIMQTFKT